MARRIEGTTLGSYSCDMPGCDANGVFAPCIMTPYENERDRRPIACMVDRHACGLHWPTIKLDDMFSKDNREAIEGCAAVHNGRPDFKRAFLRPVLVHSPEFLEFQQTAGLVPSNDAKVKGSIIMPDGFN